MSWIVESILGLHNWSHAVRKVKASLRKTDTPLRLGVLGAAAINPVAIFDPVATHPDVAIVGIAARSKAKAEAQIAKYKLSGTRAYGSYEDLLADEEIEAIYCPLPNGLHYEWALKSLAAGKHVLAEKPIASNADQVRELKRVSLKTGKIVLEAFHWRFHPAAHLVKSLAESGEYGAVQEVTARAVIPAGALAKDDIRFSYALAGGSCMDLTYVFSATSYFAVPALGEGTTIDVLEARPRINAQDKDVDEAMAATYTISNHGKTVTCHTESDLAEPWLFGLIPRIWSMPFLRIGLEKATIDFPAFPGPWVNHTITVTDKPSGKVVKKCSQYTDGPQWGTRGQRFWTTYRYMLEAFVEGVRAVQSGEKSVQEVDAGRIGIPWVPLDESIAEMGIIDQTYERAGLPLRK